ncbi:mercuric transporter MerT family protein [Nitrospira sp. M1]
MKGKGIYATGGLIGAVLASTCCIAPLVLLFLGISGAWISHLTALAPYQPVFLITSLGFLAAGFWKVYGQPKASCEESPSCGAARSDKAVKVALWVATVLIVTALSVERIGPLFL